MRSISMEFSRKEFASVMRLLLTGYLVLEREGHLENGIVQLLNRFIFIAGSTTGIKGISFDKSVEKAVIETWYMQKLSQPFHACIDEGFWDLLPVKLATRDYLDDHKGPCKDRYKPEEFMEIIRPYLETYNDELDTHGLQRIRIVTA